MSKFSKNKIVKEIKEYDKMLENILLVKIESSKLFNYLINMYQSGQGITSPPTNHQNFIYLFIYFTPPPFLQKGVCCLTSLVGKAF